MAALCWIAVTLGLLFSAGNSLAEIDQNQLAQIVNEVLNRYRPSYKGSKGQWRDPMFSLAVSIPYNDKKKMYDIRGVTDLADQVIDTILRCDVYTGMRVVAATVLRWPNVLDQCPYERVQWPEVLKQCRQKSMTWAKVKDQCPYAVKDGTADHAEFRTLQHFNTLTRNLNKNDLLLFYVLSSPCDKRCTNELHHWNILNSINQILKWNTYAVVFSKVFKPREGDPIPEENLRGALQQLGTYTSSLGSIGLSNIFRCDVNKVNRRDAVQCTSCSSGNQVTRYCYSDDSPQLIGSSLPSTSFIKPHNGKGYSPKRSAVGKKRNPQHGKKHSPKWSVVGKKRNPQHGKKHSPKWSAVGKKRKPQHKRKGFH